jgi:tight adherence protein B
VTTLASLKWSGIAVAAAGTLVLAFLAARDPKSAMNRLRTRYGEWLRGRCHALFLRIDVRPIMALQALGLYGVAMLAIGTHEPTIALGVVVVLAAPAALLEHLRRRRVARIEGQSDTFVLALASALHATANIGDAFASLVDVVEEPLRSEIDLARKHVRVGSTLEEALVMMGQRIESRAFDTALSAVLLGQRVGGHLPTVLAQTGTAIRELQRLDRATQAKVAGARIQMWGIGTIPFVIIYAMDTLQPTYFAPLLSTTTGRVAIVVAIVTWLLALVLGRKILAVSA